MDARHHCIRSMLSSLSPSSTTSQITPTPTKRTDTLSATTTPRPSCPCVHTTTRRSFHHNPGDPRFRVYVGGTLLGPGEINKHGQATACRGSASVLHGRKGETRNWELAAQAASSPSINPSSATLVDVLLHIDWYRHSAPRTQ